MIWLLTPTYGRPAAMRALVESVRNTALEPDRVAVVFGVDPDDAASKATAHDLECRVEVRPGHCGVHWWYLSLTVPEADDDLVMLCADDIRLESPAWDHKMLEQREHGRLYFGEDGIQHDALATHPWMTARTAHAIGGLTTGEWAAYNDTWLWCLFGLFDPVRRTYRPDIVTRHHWRGENPRNQGGHAERFREVGSGIATRQLAGLIDIVPSDERRFRQTCGLHGLSMALDSFGRVEVGFDG